MIAWKLKLWRSAGAAALVGLSACGPSPAPVAEAPAPAGASGEAAIGESGGEHGEAGVSLAYAGVEGDARTGVRLQHLKGYLLIAERINEGDRPEDAGVLVSQGLLEVYDPAAAEFGALNADKVRGAADGAGLTRAQMARKIHEATAAIDSARAPLALNHADLAARMVDLSTGLYQSVNQADFVDPIEYQHSLGAALSARDALVAGEAALRRENPAAYDEAIGEINRLIELWPQATAPTTPTPYPDVLRQSSRVRLALSPFL
ncbi:MAG: hypothetical protein WDM79_11500 [Terricaulis sp.]